MPKPNEGKVYVKPSIFANAVRVGVKNDCEISITVRYPTIFERLFGATFTSKVLKSVNELEERILREEKARQKIINFCADINSEREKS